MIDTLLDRLLDAPPKERESLLRELEEENPKTASRIRVLLRYADDPATIAGSVNELAPDLLGALAKEGDDRIGAEIGPYRVVSLIRRGGMGVVYLAERFDGAFEQNVAIKLTPTILMDDTRRRMFERERTHLARLEHPNIARIIDAGVTADDAPYFIMEFVDGAPVDKFCQSLAQRERLNLFLQLCDAVSYCHRALIAHGDIKPGNILVDQGRIRLLDFGIGRLLGETDGEHSNDSVSAYSPTYSAPEQRQGDAPDVRSDIYSLGAVLNTLLSLPADQSSVTPKIPQDINAIIEKSCADKPNQRYESVDALVRDVNGYLNSYPVKARESTRLYRASKFIQRNLVMTAAVIAVFVALSAGLTISAWQYRTAQQEAERAHEVTEFLKSLFDRSYPAAAGEVDITLRDIIDDAAERLPNELAGAAEVQIEVKKLIADAYAGIGEHNKSYPLRAELLAYWRDASAEPSVALAEALTNLGHEHTIQGDYDQAEALHREAIATLSALALDESIEAASAWTRLGEALTRSNPAGSSQAMQRAHAINMAIRPDDAAAITRSLANVAVGLRADGNSEEAMDASEAALALADENGEFAAPDIITMRCNLAIDFMRLGFRDKASRTQERCVELQSARLGTDHPNLVSSYNNLATLHLNAGRLEEAEYVLLTALDVAEKKLPDSSLSRIAANINLALTYLHAREPERALPIIETAHKNMKASLGADHPATFRTQNVLARVVLELGDPIRAADLLENSLEGLTPTWRADALLWLAECNLKLGEDTAATTMAQESLSLRQSIPFFSPWQSTEAELVLAKAMKNDSHAQNVFAQLSSQLPSNHLRLHSLN